MKILCVGGGSGGHITPIVAVINKLLNKKGQTRKGKSYDIRVWCDRKFASQAKKLLADANIRVDIIAAGKLRRYANLKWWYRWFSPYHIIHTHIPNLIDMFKIAGGFIQSFVKLLIWRPDVVFCKGGYVSLPVGVVAHLYHIPLVIHDSDTVPGLTNRVLAKYADAIGTGAPVENYPSYPKQITKFVGVPVRNNVKSISKDEQAKLKDELELDAKRPLILAMGGGLGAVAINNAMIDIGKKLVDDGYQVVLLTGRGHDVDVSRGIKKYFHAYDFSNKIVEYEQVADVVVTRAGATTMAELAAIGVPTIMVPSPYLSGDHQSKNAEVYAKAEAAVVVNEFDMKDDPNVLYKAISDLLNDDKRRAKLSQNLHGFAKGDALDVMVDMIIKAPRKH